MFGMNFPRLKKNFLTHLKRGGEPLGYLFVLDVRVQDELYEMHEELSHALGVSRMNFTRCRKNFLTHLECPG